MKNHNDMIPSIRITFAWPLLTTLLMMTNIVPAQALFWSTSIVECFPIPGAAKSVDNDNDADPVVCGYVAARTCVIGSCNSDDPDYHNGVTGSDVPTPTFSDVPSPPNSFSDVPSYSVSDVPSYSVSGVPSPTYAYSDNPTVTDPLAIRRDVEYSFVADDKYQGEEYPYDLQPVDTIKVSLTINYDCEVLVNDQACSSCSYCGDDQYTADCTNLPHGRTTMCELAAVDDFANRPVAFFYPLVYVPPLLSVVPSLAPSMLTSSSIPSPIRIDEVLNLVTTNSGNDSGVDQRDDVDDAGAVPPSVMPSLAPSMLTSSSIPSPIRIEVLDVGTTDSGNDNEMDQRDDIDDAGDDGDDDTDTSSSSLLLALCSCLL
jgi:hypothetical protein